MTSWALVSQAIVRGAVRALPLTPGILSDVLRFVEDAAGHADAGVLAVIRQRAGGAELGASPGPAELREIEQLARTAAESLSPADRDALKATAKTLVVEDEPRARERAACELALGPCQPRQHPAP